MKEDKAEKLLRKINDGINFRKLRLEEPNTIRLNPKDIKKLEKCCTYRSFLKRNITQMKILGLKIEEDKNLKEGECIIWQNKKKK